MGNLISTINAKFNLIRPASVAIALVVACFFSPAKLNAQVIIYSQSFTQSAVSTTQCNAWETFRAALLAYSYNTLTVEAGSPNSTITCTNPTIIADIALKLRTGVAGTWVDGSNTWNVGICGSGGSPSVTGWELSVNNGNCLCSSGYAVRPCIGNSNWGGYSTNCGAPSQTMTVTFAAGPPCPLPSNLTVTGVFSTSAFFNWTAPSQSNGSEYIVNTTATPPTGTPSTTHTTNTTGSATGLTPSTTYYLHVRNKCDSPSKSLWVTTQFTTLPPCILAPNINVPQVDTNSAIVTWGAIVPAVEYQYIVTKTKGQPDPANATSTTSTQVGFSSLEAGTIYYVYVRAKCLGGDSSGWILDSFYVPLPCRAPEVMFNDLNAERVVAYWDKPITSYEYEILNSSVAIPSPAAGIKQKTTSYLFPYLDENTTYYVYSKSYCDDQGIKSESPWGSTSYKTWALGIGDVEDEINSLGVYPNPVKGEMIVTVTGKRTGAGQLTIMDVSGKVLKVLATDNKRQIVVNLDGLAAGIYVAQYTDELRREQVRFNKQ